MNIIHKNEADHPQNKADHPLSDGSFRRMNIIDKISKIIRRKQNVEDVAVTADTMLARSALREFQRVIGYKFKDEKILKCALTHRSFAGAEDADGMSSNERLEFLGDSVVNCLVTEYLYFTYPDKSEGHLSKMKSLIVSRKILGEIAFEFGTGNYMVMSASEEKTGGRERMSIVSNAFEAIVGAMYIDGGLGAVKKFLERSLFGRIGEFLEDEDNVNYKSKILEMAQRDGRGMPRYVTAETSGPDHAKFFRVKLYIDGEELGEGSGSSKKKAQQIAAKMAVGAYVNK